MEQIKKYSSTTESKTVSAGTKAKFQIPETTQIIQKIEEEEKEEEESENNFKSFLIGMLSLAILKKRKEEKQARDLEQSIVQEQSNEKSSCGCF